MHSCNKMLFIYVLSFFYMLYLVWVRLWRINSLYRVGVLLTANASVLVNSGLWVLFLPCVTRFSLGYNIFFACLIIIQPILMIFEYCIIIVFHLFKLMYISSWVLYGRKRRTMPGQQHARLFLVAFLICIMGYLTSGLPIELMYGFFL